MINNFGDNDNYGAGYGYGSYGEQPAAPVQEPLANNPVSYTHLTLPTNREV